MQSALLQRMKREIKMLEDCPAGILCYPTDTDYKHFQAQITGPKGTPYEGGIFKIDIKLPDRYPFEPPNANFNTPIYHPNIDAQGRICLDILKMPPNGAWAPSLNIRALLVSLSALMGDPNPDDPLDVEIAKEYKENRGLFLKKAKESTSKYAIIENDIEKFSSFPATSVQLNSSVDLDASLNTEASTTSAETLGETSKLGNDTKSTKSQSDPDVPHSLNAATKTSSKRKRSLLSTKGRDTKKTKT
ncbi:uncharacterized protein VTP21DRAFT_5780 [Calcarisporiella thermophila]|uniref:uncharacterized protein n=1 Tax=Calcarisporiella thermophila TaxID=911321 RepID=UPI003743D291